MANAQLVVELQRHRERLYAVGASESAVKERVAHVLPKLRLWADRFLKPGQTKDRVAKFDHSVRTPLRIVKIVEVEQSVWSPMWGLTGKVDVVVEAALDGSAPCVVPLELKASVLTVFMSVSEALRGL